jgi:hypothetical protein
MCLDQSQGTDLFGKGHSFNGRGQAKLGCQHAAACFVDIQGGAALVGAGQHPHQLTIGGFVQRVVFEQTAYRAFGLCQLAGAFLKGGQLFQYGRYLHLKLLALQEEPLVELQTVRQREFF